MTDATTERTPVLVGRRLDGWLTGWFAVALWVVAWLARQRGSSFVDLGVPWYWPATALTAAHFGMSYHLAYGGGRTALARRPIALVAAPAILALTLVGVIVLAVARGGNSVRTVSAQAVFLVFAITTWHYIKQAYGVVRIGARNAGIRLSAGEANVLRYGLYPLWFIGSAKVLSSGVYVHYAGLDITHRVLPQTATTVARVIGGGCALVIVGCIVRVAFRHHVRPPSTMLAPNIAAFVWLLLPVDPVSVTIGLGAMHALQYLACCHRAHLTRSPQRRPFARWVEIFGGAACAGLLLTLWLPSWLDRQLSIEGVPFLATAALFVFLNLHHYMIDAVIWRSKGDIVRAMVRGPAASPPAVLSPAGSR